MPLPESPEISWDSQKSHKSGSLLEVINKQPCSSTSPISVGDKSVNYYDTVSATDVVHDLNVLFANVNTANISALAAVDANPAVPVPVAQNLQGIDVGVDIDPQIQPISVAQGTSGKMRMCGAADV